MLDEPRPAFAPRAPARAAWLGRRRYGEVHALQKRLVEERVAGRCADTVLLLEHEPVITLGRAANPANVLMARLELERRGYDLVETERGGDVTYHGPGQLVAYPIVHLAPDRQNVRAWVRALAETMIQIAAAHGISAGYVHDLVGVWVDRDAPAAWPGRDEAHRLAKLGAIGVRISRWVTMHGLAINLATALEDFALIVPCGISQHGVTSIADLTGHAPSVRDTALGLAPTLSRALSLDVTAPLDLEGVSDLQAALGLDSRSAPPPP